MTYKEALDYISSTERFGSRPGLDRMRMLLDMMGNPQDAEDAVQEAVFSAWRNIHTLKENNSFIHQKNFDNI